MPILFTVTLWALAATAWRGFFRPNALPVHMLAGEQSWDRAALRALPHLVAALRVGALPLVILAGPEDRGGWLAVGCLAVLLAVVLLRQRPLRSAAAPMLEDGVWLSGLAAVTLVVHGGSLAVFAASLVLGASLLVLVVGLQVLFWGSGSRFWISARPDFQVFAPNPDNRYAMGRIHIGESDAVALVPDTGSPYPAIGVYDLRFRRVALARWEEVRALFDEHGDLRVHVGTERDPSAGHLSFAVPPGRYYLTVRNYLCGRPEAPALPVHVR